MRPSSSSGHPHHLQGRHCQPHLCGPGADHRAPRWDLSSHPLEGLGLTSGRGGGICKIGKLPTRPPFSVGNPTPGRWARHAHLESPLPDDRDVGSPDLGVLPKDRSHPPLPFPPAASSRFPGTSPLRLVALGFPKSQPLPRRVDWIFAEDGKHQVLMAALPWKGRALGGAILPSSSWTEALTGSAG